MKKHHHKSSMLPDQNNYLPSHTYLLCFVYSSPAAGIPHAFHMEACVKEIHHTFLTLPHNGQVQCLHARIHDGFIR